VVIATSSVHRDAISSVIVSGNGNKVIVYHYHLEAAPSEGVQVASQALGANPYRGLASFRVKMLKSTSVEKVKFSVYALESA
jgi:hypothetical protein